MSQVALDTKTIDVAEEFSKTPGGRYYTDGPASGEQFREEVLIPALRDYQRVEIILDGARGYPSSFLEEAFGGLVRKLKVPATELLARMTFQATGGFKVYVDDIRFHMQRAANGRNR